ncbi:MAG: hypothetical protein RL291_97 [Pseudomonadota bacterium]|jgi:uncharacterized protein (TIGR02301 family)
MQINAKAQVIVKARLAAAAVLVLAMSLAPVAAQVPSSDIKPYDDRLVRLAEILGSVHFLRELCGANDGQFWRQRMQSLMDSEGSSALRRARLARSFNTGYNNYSRTYNACTASAQQAITRFLNEGADIADQLVKTVP